MIRHHRESTVKSSCRRRRPEPACPEGYARVKVKLDLLSQIHRQILDRAMSELHKDFQLTSSRLGDSVGLTGAAAMVWDQLGVER